MSYDLQEQPIEPQPTELRNRDELLKDYDVTIKFFNLGCCIFVGCKSIAFTSIEEAMEALNEYIKEPKKTIQKWRKILG